MNKTLKIVGYTIVSFILFFPLLLILLTGIFSAFEGSSGGSLGSVVGPLVIAVPVSFVLSLWLTIVRVNNAVPKSIDRFNAASQKISRFIPGRKVLLTVAFIFIVLLLSMLWQISNS